jgi:AAA domain
VWQNREDYRKVQRFPRESDHLWQTLPRFDPRYVPTTRWLIESFLAERSIQLVLGERGSFKSTLMLAAAKAVTNRADFLGLKTRRRRVLYLDYENPAAVIKARIHDLGLEVHMNKHLKIWDRFGPQPTPRPDDPLLENIVRECVAETGHGPWIIFDSWGQSVKTWRRRRIHGTDRTNLPRPSKTCRSRCNDSIHNLSIFLNKARPGNPIIRVESWLKRAAPQGEGSFAFEVQSERDRKGNWHIVGLIPAQDPEEAQLQEEIDVLRNLIKQNPNAGQEEIARLAADQRIPRDRAIKLLKDGAGKYWQVRRTKSQQAILFAD